MNDADLEMADSYQSRNSINHTDNKKDKIALTTEEGCDIYKMYVSEDLTNVSYWVFFNGGNVGMSTTQIERFVAKNLAMSFVILLMQIFCTLTILIDWFDTLKKVDKVHKTLKDFDNVKLVYKPINFSKF